MSGAGNRALVMDARILLILRAQSPTSSMYLALEGLLCTARGTVMMPMIQPAAIEACLSRLATASWNGSDERTRHYVQSDWEQRADMPDSRLRLRLTL